MKKWMKQFTITMFLALLCLISLATGCQSMRDTAVGITDEEIKNVETAREISARLLAIWPYQSGFIKGILGSRIDELPTYTIDAINELDALAKSENVSDSDLGKSLGLRIRMVCETVKQVIRTYYPDAVDLLTLL